MGKGDYLGEFEQIVLLALIRLRENAYGVSIWREIEKRTRRVVLIGAVYTALERLHKKGYISSWLAEPTSVRGGKAKRYYRIEAPGEAALRQTRNVLNAMWEGIEVPAS